MILNFLIIFLILLENIKSGVLKDCQIGNYCTNGACSTNGNCKIDILTMKAQTNMQSRCECNIGYSSYDIEVQNLGQNRVYCCYEKKSQFIAFILEICLSFGIGHFYIGDMTYGLVKFFLELFLYFISCCLIYRACNQEHEIVINLNNNPNIKEDYKMDENIDNEEIKELNENIENDKNSDNDSKNDDEEDNKYNEILTKDLIKCPVYKLLIYISFILLFIIYICDIIFLGLGFFKDKEGEDLAFWY